MRHRQPSTRGSGRGSNRGRGRGGAEREHHHCCYCYCYRREGVTPLHAGQITEVGGVSEEGPALPAFGSVVFTLGNSRDPHGICAHVSVLFTQVPEGAGEEAPPGGEDTPHAGLEQANPLPPPPSGEGTSGKASMADPSTSRTTTAIDEERAKWAAMWEGVPEGQGWCTIEEEKPPADE